MKSATSSGGSTVVFRLYKEFFRALGNATRFRIVQLLREGPRNVGEIAESLGFEQSRVSHSLACLLNWSRPGHAGKRTPIALAPKHTSGVRSRVRAT